MIRPITCIQMIFNEVCCDVTLWCSSHPADVVLAFCGDGLIDDFLAADAQENFLHFVQEALQCDMKTLIGQ